MKNLNNTIRLARNLRKGQHEKFATQKAMDRIRANEKCVQTQLPLEDDIVGREEPHGEVDSCKTHLQNPGM